MIGLSDWRCVSASLPPLCTPIEHRHPLTFYPDSERLKRSRPVFSYLPEGLPMLRCAAARFSGRLQSLPFGPTPTYCMATSLESNPCRYDKRLGEG